MEFRCKSDWRIGAAQFHQTLEAARMYLHFRWLGEQPEKAVSEKNLWRYRQLRLAAKTLGLT